MAHTPRRRRVVSAVLAALALGTAAAAPASATDPSTRPPAEVPWKWWDGGVHAVQNNGSALPGMNDDSCRPSPAHPNPVVLLHGMGANGPDNWATLGQALLNEGYCVWAPTYGAPQWMPKLGAMPLAGGHAGLPGNAHSAVAEVDRVQALTGAAKVDLVGMSQGTLVAGYIAKVLRPGRIGTVVTMTGVWPSPGMRSLLEPMGLPADMGGSVADLQRNSGAPDGIDEWLGEDDTPFHPGTRYTLIATDPDGMVPPFHSLAGNTPGAEKVMLQDGCPQDRSTHLNLYASPRAVDITLNALDPAHAKPLRCVPADPILGVTAPVPPR